MSSVTSSTLSTLTTTFTTTPTPSTTPENTTFPVIIDPRCSSYYSNSSGILIKEYEGIPENLIVNLAAWVGLLVLFTFLRRIGDYGRFGLIKNDEERWSARFFGNFSKLENESTHSTASSSSSDTDHQTASLRRPRSDSQQAIHAESSSRPSMLRSGSVTSHDYPHAREYKDKHLLSWLIYIFKLKDKHINEKCGKDAIYYLVFQRYLIVYLFIVTIISVSVLLPINLNGTALADNRVFGSTTIVNILPNSSVLWVHLVLSWFFFIVGVIFMRQFSKRMDYTEADYVSRTVLITNFPRKYCKSELIFKHFEQAYPDLTLSEVQFAYDVSEISKLDRQRRAMHIGKITSERIYEQTNRRPQMHPFHFGSLVELCCCCCSSYLLKKNANGGDENNPNSSTDSISFYSKNENELTLQINSLKQEVLKHPLGIAFVTFETQKMAESFLKHYRLGPLGHFLNITCAHRMSCYLCRDLARSSELSTALRSDHWYAKYAPSPNNIKWENLSKIGAIWWFRVILINLILIILMIFFTTPSILIEKLTPWSELLKINTFEQYLPSYIVEFLPSLVLRLLAALLPVLVAYTALAELHWTRSAENRSMMVKTFILLLFMVLVLPTLGLTSINALLEWLNTKDNSSILIKWTCVSDNGAFFLKYVTTCSFIGTALDLLRLPDLLLYVIKMLYSRSSAERLAVRMQAAFEFDYGVQYAWILTVFTVTLSFSVVCPLITPFGLTYMILKHLVDRYNIYFAYISTKVDKNIHKSAVTFSIVSFILLQICILFFIAVKNKGNINTNVMSTLQTIIIIVTVVIFCGRLFFGVFKRFSPFDHTGANEQADLNISDYNIANIDTDASTNTDNDTNNRVGINSSSEVESSGNGAVSSAEENTSPLGSSKPIRENNTQQEETNRDMNKLKSPIINKPRIVIHQSPFIPNILRPNTSTETVKLNSLRKKQLSQKTASGGEKPQNERRKDSKKSTEGHRNILYEDQVDVEIDDPPISLSPDHETALPSTLNYGTLATTSTNLFQQEPDFKSENLDVSTDQETPLPIVERNHSRVNQAFTNDDLI